MEYGISQPSLEGVSYLFTEILHNSCSKSNMSRQRCIRKPRGAFVSMSRAQRWGKKVVCIGPRLYFYVHLSMYNVYASSNSSDFKILQRASKILFKRFCKSPKPHISPSLSRHQPCFPEIRQSSTQKLAVRVPLYLTARALHRGRHLNSIKSRIQKMKADTGNDHSGRI